MSDVLAFSSACSRYQYDAYTSWIDHCYSFVELVEHEAQVNAPAKSHKSLVAGTVSVIVILLVIIALLIFREVKQRRYVYLKLKHFPAYVFLYRIVVDEAILCVVIGPPYYNVPYDLISKPSNITTLRNWTVRALQFAQ